MIVHDHPWWTIYGVIAACLYGLLLADLSKNRQRDPEDQIPWEGYVVWAVLNAIWPAVALTVAALIAAID